MVGARLRRCRAAAAEGRRAAGPGTAHRQRERRRLGPVALVREAARSMELRAVEESRVDEDDMRAVECVVVRKTLRKEIFLDGETKRHGQRQFGSHS